MIVVVVMGLFDDFVGMVMWVKLMLVGLCFDWVIDFDVVCVCCIVVMKVVLCVGWIIDLCFVYYKV